MVTEMSFLAGCFIRRHATLLLLVALSIMAQPCAAFLPPAMSLLARKTHSPSATKITMHQQEDSQSKLWLPNSAMQRREAIGLSLGSLLAAGYMTPLAADAAQGRDLPSTGTANPTNGIIKLKNGGGQFPLMSFGLQVCEVVLIAWITPCIICTFKALKTIQTADFGICRQDSQIVDMFVLYHAGIGCRFS